MSMPLEGTELNLKPGEILDLTLIDISQVKIDAKYCVTEDVHDDHVASANRRGLPPFSPRMDGAIYDPIAVVCSGPSLAAQIGEVRKFTKILTCSGAHDFLIQNGIVPNWHVEADPREHKVKFLGNPHPKVQYLLASSCHPALFNALEGHDVHLWHTMCFERRRGVPAPSPRDHWMITGGSNVGMRALVIARMLGYTNIHLFGMDCSASDSAFHVNAHPNEPRKEKWFQVRVGPFEYWTSQVFLFYAQQFFREIAQIDAGITLHGEGLLQALSAQSMSDPERMKRFMEMRPAVSTLAHMNASTISSEYVDLNRRMHEENESYGSMGYRHADYVIDVMESARKRGTPIESVLDYGCGKGALARKLPFPIWEYDPAIPGKDAVPRSADFVICTDVLEHVEPEMLDNTLRDLVRCTLKIGYFVIFTGPAGKSLPDGRNTHLIQQDASWWREKLSTRFDIAKIIEQGRTLIVVVGPKRVPAPTAGPTSTQSGSSQRRWHVLEHLIKTNDWSKGVEIGVKEGFTFLHLLQSCPALDLTGVDLFEPRPGLEQEGGESHLLANLPEHESRLRRVVQDQYNNRARLIKAFSTEAARSFPDHSLDFVFIDADHREESVLADICAWRPKIRPGGMLTGHDAQSKFPGVLAALKKECQGWEPHPDSVWTWKVS